VSGDRELFRKEKRVRSGGTTSTLITRGAIFKLVNYASEMIRTGSNLGVKA
jgi:hypothetical protein